MAKNISTLLVTHTRNIYVEMFKHHIIYTIPFYNDMATSQIIDFKKTSHDLVLTVKRDEMPLLRFGVEKSLSPVSIEPNAPTGSPDEIGSKRRGDFESEWRLA